MKQMVVEQPGGFDRLLLRELDIPTPGHNEVLVRWHATSLNFHDLLVANGSIPVGEHRVPMSDGAGEIVALGSNVSAWQEGDKVMSLFFPAWLDGSATAEKTKLISGETTDGFAQEYSCVSADSLTSMPDSYTYAEAATLPCAALTAWRGLVPEGNLKAGDSVLIEGSGGMSIFGLQLAKAAGAYVYATTSSEAKAEKMRAMGADEVINYKEDEAWGKTLFKRSGGINHVLDIGGPSTLPQAVEAVAIGGQITLIGILGGRKSELVLPKIFFKHVSLNGIAVGSKSMQQDLVAAINVSGLKPVVDKSFSLDGLAAAFEYQLSGAHFGKIVIEY